MSGGWDTPMEVYEAGADAAESESKDAARWRKFSRMACGEQRWMCACADKSSSGWSGSSLNQLIDGFETNTEGNA